MSRRLADIDAYLVHETAAAYLLRVGDKEAWVPKSVTENNDNVTKGQSGSFTIPKDMAVEKELV